MITTRGASHLSENKHKYQLLHEQCARLSVDLSSRFTSLDSKASLGGNRTQPMTSTHSAIHAASLQCIRQVVHVTIRSAVILTGFWKLLLLQPRLKCSCFVSNMLHNSNHLQLLMSLLQVSCVDAISISCCNSPSSIWTQLSHPDMPSSANAATFLDWEQGSQSPDIFIEYPREIRILKATQIREEATPFFSRRAEHRKASMQSARLKSRVSLVAR